MKNWQRVNGETIHQIGRRRVVERRYREANGNEIDFAIHLERATVCTMVVTPALQIVLIRQFRPGPELILDELPGGAIEEDEAPNDAAQREVLEEVGYSGRLIPLGSSLTCAYSTRIRHHFLMPEAVRVASPRNDADEQEQGTEVILKDQIDFMKQVDLGLLTDSETALRAMRRLGW